MKAHPELLDEAVGNDRADKAAKAARSEFYNSNIVRLGHLLAKRTDGYTFFIKQLHAVICRVHVASQLIKASPAHGLEHNITQ
eukprot:9524536-Karenia_brevis.AAC.1